MAINKKLIFWNNQSNFSPPTSKTDTTQSVYWESIVFFGDTKQIWTHGVYFGSSLNTTLNGYLVGSNTAITSSDTVLEAFGKTQAQLNNKQPLDADLTAIAALAGTSGYLKKTTADTWTLDTNSYLPLSGGTITGVLTLIPVTGASLKIEGSSTSMPRIQSYNSQSLYINELGNSIILGSGKYIISSDGGSYSGNAATATTATNVTITATNTAATYYPTFASATSGNQVNYVDTNLTYNPSTNTLTATRFVGALTGIASGNLALTGGTLTGNLTFQDDGEGVIFNGSGKIYKKSGTGIVINRGTNNVDPQIETADGSSIWKILHAGNWSDYAAAASHDHNSLYYTETEIGNFFGGSTSITGYNKTDWDAASVYTAGYNTVTTMASLPITKQSVLANLTGDSALSLDGTLSNGKFMYIKLNNTSSSQIILDLSGSNLFETWDTVPNLQALLVPTKKLGELRIWAINDKYILSVPDDFSVADWKYQTIATSSYLKVSSNFGKTWTTKFSSGFGTCAISRSGQYQIAATSAAGGTLYLSTNYGSTWTSKQTSTGTWAYAFVSPTGQYMYASTLSPDKTYRSSDYGSTWTIIDTSDSFPVMGISPSGQYLYRGGTYSKISSNYGETFTSLSARYDYYWKINDSGKIVSLVNNNGYLNFSTNLGSTWTTIYNVDTPKSDRTIQLPYISSDCNFVITNPGVVNRNRIYSFLSDSVVKEFYDAGGETYQVGYCSYDGKYITMTGNPDTAAWYSNDYGTTFYPSVINIPSSPYAAYCLSSSGRFVALRPYGSLYSSVSTDYGRSFSPLTEQLTDIKAWAVN